MGRFLFGVSMETSDFFQNEARRCKENAERAPRKADSEFWLNLASRCETLSQAGQEGGGSGEAILQCRDAGVYG